jgi:cytochrome c oxidase cbb3-type subunit 2
MPNYPWLLNTPLDTTNLADRLKALRTTGVPYSANKAEYDNNVKEFGAEVAKQLHIPDAQKNLIEQAQTGKYDGNAADVTEMDAIVAYLQVLGTMVDFSKLDNDSFVKFR